MSDERLLILQMLKDGKVSVEEAERLLAAIDKKDDRSEEPREQEFSAKEGDRQEKRKDPWNELGEFWEKFGSEMESFWKDFGENIEESLGQKFAQKMEHFAENFGNSMRHISKDWTTVAGEGIKQVFDSLGVDSEVFISVDRQGVKRSRTFDLDHDGQDIQLLSIDNIKGHVTAEGCDGDRISIQIESSLIAETEEKAEERLAALSFEPRVEAGVVQFVMKSDDNTRPRQVTNQYTISIPRTCSLKVDQVKGPVTIRNIGGDVMISGQKCDVEVVGCAGNVTIQETKGDAVITGCEGNCHVQMARGDLSVSELGGSLNGNILKGDASLRAIGGAITMQLAMGDVHVDGCGDSIEITTSKGDVELVGVTSSSVTVTTNRGDQSLSIDPIKGGRYAFTSHHGDLQLTLPETVSAIFNVHIIGGSISSNIFPDTHSRAPLTIHETIGDGDAEVSINLVKGDCEIVRESGNEEKTNDETGEATADESE